MDPMGTHAPVLALYLSELGEVPHNVLELGVGLYSTPLMHYLCRAYSQLHSAETDGAWLTRFRYMETDRHVFHHVSEWDTFDLIESMEWGLAFVDNAPGESRARLIHRLRSRARYVVVHDTETDYATGADYKYEPEFARYRYRADFRKLRPYTTVVSDFVPLDAPDWEKTWTPPEE
jgi:hypothetical protein